jgi:hypothetical protein
LTTFYTKEEGPTLDTFFINKSLYQRRKGKRKIMADQAILENMGPEGSDRKNFRKWTR